MDWTFANCPVGSVWQGGSSLPSWQPINTVIVPQKHVYAPSAEGRDIYIRYRPLLAEEENVPVKAAQQIGNTTAETPKPCLCTRFGHLLRSFHTTNNVLEVPGSTCEMTVNRQNDETRTREKRADFVQSE